MIWIGTSGYNYPEWKGTFYPADLPASKMLAFYSARFPTVEINYTFYRLPTEKLVAGWAAGTPSPYKLTLKAPKRITHDKRLRDAGDLLRAFCHAAGTLGDKLGMLLFQLAPNFKVDLAVFDAFLADLPPGARAAFEFRHPSWFDEARLRPPARPQPRAVHRRQREAVDAGRRDRRLRLLPLEGRRVRGRRHRPLGRHHPRAPGSVEGHLRVLQARGIGERAGVRSPLIERLAETDDCRVPIAD